MSATILNFMIRGAEILVLGCGHILHLVKMLYFFKNLLLYTQTFIRQTEGIVMMTKEDFTNIVDYIIHGTTVPLLRHSHIVKIQYLFSSSCRHWDTDLTNEVPGVYKNDDQ